MRSTLDAFLAVLKELRGFIESMQAVYAALASHPSLKVREGLNVRRRLDYAAFVVTLYAAFETYVEDLAWSHTEIESARNKYSELPESLRRKHLRDSAEILRARLGEGRYAGIGEMDIVGNLYRCLSENEAYRLNRHAVIHHNLNLRSEVVQEIFSNLGVEGINARTRRSEPLLAWFSKAEGLEIALLTEIPEGVIALRMQQIVERRNQVAHSGGDLNESLAPEEMEDRLAFLEAYSRSLFNVLAGSYLDRYYVRTGGATALGEPIDGPLKGGSVFVVRKPSCRLWIGQPVFGRREDKVDRWGEVKELRVDDVAVNSVEVISPATEIGLCTSFRSTKGTRLYVLDDKDGHVWG